MSPLCYWPLRHEVIGYESRPEPESNPFVSLAGLFHRVIGQSGAIVSPWPIDRDPVKSTTRIAELAGCPTESYADLSNCLRTINDTQLTEAALAYQVCCGRKKTT